jgi:hypothetical protein
MAMVDLGGARRQTIATALAAELERQNAGSAERLDIDALAGAVEQALGAAAPEGEGKRPDELNATNDD